jgi:hypothetical protein
MSENQKRALAEDERSHPGASYDCKVNPVWHSVDLTREETKRKNLNRLYASQVILRSYFDQESDVQAFLKGTNKTDRYIFSIRIASIEEEDKYPRLLKERIFSGYYGHPQSSESIKNSLLVREALTALMTEKQLQSFQEEERAYPNAEHILKFWTLQR